MLSRALRPEVRDSTLLFLLVILSALPYEFRLGFYSDDWFYHEILVGSASHGFPAMFHSLLANDPGMRVRPVQAAYLVLGFKLFGQHAIGYHLVNSITLAAVTVLLFLVLRIFEATREISLSAALVYALLPHYSTVRFWIACHQAGLSMAFALFGIYALSRHLDTAGRRNAWLLAAGVAFVLSFFSYEVPVGLIAFAIVALGVREYRRRQPMPRTLVERFGGFSALTLLLLVVGVLKGKSQTRMVTHAPASTLLLLFLQRSWRTLAVAFRFDFHNYGFKLPIVIFRLYREAAFAWQSVLAAIFLAVVISVYLKTRSRQNTEPRLRAVVLYLALGFVFFYCGYLLFIMVVDPFSTPGVQNRVTIASALGVAFSELALIELIACGVRSKSAIEWVRSLGVGTLCGANCLVLYGISHFWIDAAIRQKDILSEVSTSLSSLPRDSVVLLDGFCRYSGPAPVFETDWDTTGALRLTLKNPSLKADVVSPTLRLSEAAVETSMYGAPEGHYVYGEKLFVYDLRQGALVPLSNRAEAEAFFMVNDPKRSDCPPAQEGRGAKIF